MEDFTFKPEYGFDEEDWNEFTQKEKEAAIRAFNRKIEVQAETPAPSVSIGTKDEALVAFMCQLIGNAELAIRLARTFGTAENLKTFCSAITAYADKDAKFDKLDEKVVVALSQTSPQELLDRVKQERKQHVPVTIFNYGELIVQHPAIKSVEQTENNIIYTVGKERYIMPINDNVKAFAVAKTMLGAASSALKNVEHIMFLYDPKVEILCRLIAFNYNVQLMESGIKFGRKGIVRLPSNITDDMKHFMKGPLDQIEAIIRNHIDSVLPVSAIDSQDVLSIIYAAAFQYKWNENDQLMAELGILRAKFKKQLSVKFELTEQEKSQVGNVSGDTTLQDLKKELNESRDWRAMTAITDKESHDWMLKADYMRLSSTKWGAAHMTTLVLDACAEADEKEIGLVEFFGPKGANAAQAIEVLREKAPDAIKWLDPKATLRTSGTGRLVYVPGWEMLQFKTPHPGTGVPVDKTTPGPVPLGCRKRLFVVDTFLEQKSGEEVDDHILRLLGDFSKQATPYTVAINTHVMGFDKFDRILRACRDNKCGLRIWKHPRLHNDSVYLIMDSEKTLDANAVYAWFSAMKCALENNKIRNLGLYVGMRPERPTDVYDKNLVRGLFAALHLKEQFKSVTAKLQSSTVAKDSVAMQLILQQGGGVPGATPPPQQPPPNNNNSEDIPEAKKEEPPAKKNPRDAPPETRQSKKRKDSDA